MNWREKDESFIMNARTLVDKWERSTRLLKVLYVYKHTHTLWYVRKDLKQIWTVFRPSQPLPSILIDSCCIPYSHMDNSKLQRKLKNSGLPLHCSSTCKLLSGLWKSPARISDTWFNFSWAIHDQLFKLILTDTINEDFYSSVVRT